MIIIVFLKGNLPSELEKKNPSSRPFTLSSPLLGWLDLPWLVDWLDAWMSLSCPKQYWRQFALGGGTDQNTSPPSFFSYLFISNSNFPESVCLWTNMQPSSSLLLILLIFVGTLLQSSASPLPLSEPTNLDYASQSLVKRNKMFCLTYLAYHILIQLAITK